MSWCIPHVALTRLGFKVPDAFTQLVRQAESADFAGFRLYAYGSSGGMTMTDLKRFCAKDPAPGGLAPFPGMKDSPGGLLCLYRKDRLDAYDVVTDQVWTVKPGDVAMATGLARLNGRLPGDGCSSVANDQWPHTVRSIDPLNFDTTGFRANACDESADGQFHMHERAVRWLRDKRRLVVKAETDAKWAAASPAPAAQNVSVKVEVKTEGGAPVKPEAGCSSVKVEVKNEGGAPVKREAGSSSAPPPKRKRGTDMSDETRKETRLKRLAPKELGKGRRGHSATGEQASRGELGGE